MKKIYSALFLVFTILLSVNGKAQCTGCTTNITGLDAANHIIGAGQSVCVSPTGTLTGLVTITSGGSLCNEGNINSTNLWVAGGTLKNYGTLNTNNVLVSSAGTFTNYATLDIDSLLITQTNSKYVNNGSQSGTAFSITRGASATNGLNGTITAYNMGDSLGSFTNNGYVLITNFFANSYTSTCTNNGNITVNNDFYNSYSSNFINTNYLKVLRHFYNSTSCNFVTNCMVSIGGDWYNTGKVYGPSAPNCGGFYITGGSYSSGTIGSSSTRIDICDAGHPAGGIDGATGGTIENTTTYCTCNNVCATAISVKEIETGNTSISNIFPNPSSGSVNIILNTLKTEVALLEVTDMMGKIVISKQAIMLMGEQTMQLDVNSLAEGTYILSITNTNNTQVKRLFSVAK